MRKILLLIALSISGYVTAQIDSLRHIPIDTLALMYTKDTLTIVDV